MNKTALITGASKGIGKALAEKMLDEGYHVIGTSRSGDIDIKHAHFKALALDVSNATSIEHAHGQIFSTYKQIDVLINNAGIGPDLHLDHPEADTFDLTFDVNVKGVVFFTEALIKLVPKDGKIINVSSKMGSLEVCEKYSSVAYRMSKSALNMYTKILANRLKDNIHIACIHPGWVQTTIIESNLVNATLTPEESANRIYRFISSHFKTGVYWDCEDNLELPW